jgi:hypothetical protein
MEGIELKTFNERTKCVSELLLRLLHHINNKMGKLIHRKGYSSHEEEIKQYALLIAHSSQTIHHKAVHRRVYPRVKTAHTIKLAKI